MDEDRRVAIIGAELDLGAGRRGVDMGPSAIRYAGLGERLKALGIPSEDWGNVYTRVRETMEAGEENARFLTEIREVCERIAEQVRNASENGLTPLVLGGDHSVALGTIGGLASVHGPGGVLWFDAHGDLNTPSTTPSGNVHGMPLAAVLGRAGVGFESNSWSCLLSRPSTSPSSARAASIRANGRRSRRPESPSTRSPTSTGVASSPCSRRRSSTPQAPLSSTSRSISISSIPTSRRASVPR